MKPDVLLSNKTQGVPGFLAFKDIQTPVAQVSYTIFDFRLPKGLAILE